MEQEDPKPVQYLNEQEILARELLILYRQQPVLWDQKHPNYRHRSKRQEAYEVLIDKARDYFQEADEDFVKTKIESMRTTFRREYRKVMASAKLSNNPEERYKPTLWYYNLLLFIMDNEARSSDLKNQHLEHNDTKIVNQIKKVAPVWTRQNIALLIEQYKKYPYLYDSKHPHYKIRRKRQDTLKKIAISMSSATGQFFSPRLLARKLESLRDRFNHDYNNIKSQDKPAKSNLWFYDMLSFLKDHHKTRLVTKYNPDQAQKVDVKSAPNFLAKHHSVVQDNDDTIAKNVAHKLREMSDAQRRIAERIVKDVMYHGLMENLTPNSRLLLDSS